MLDISYLSDVQGDKPSFVLHDRDIKLFDSAFLMLEQKTGVFIDPYGKTRIYPDHQRMLVAYLQKDKQDKVLEFINFLSGSIDEDEVLIADGD